MVLLRYVYELTTRFRVPNSFTTVSQNKGFGSRHPAEKDGISRRAHNCRHLTKVAPYRLNGSGATVRALDFMMDAVKFSAVEPAGERLRLQMDDLPAVTEIFSQQVREVGHV